jgi:hypothetical protein
MNLRVKRIQTKLSELYKDKIDMPDFKDKNEDKTNQAFLSRALSAYAIVLKTGISVDESAKYITDGYNDNGIDCIYKDQLLKKLYLVQFKMINDGNGSIDQGDTSKFCSGVDKVLNLDFENANKKITDLDDII